MTLRPLALLIFLAFASRSSAQTAERVVLLGNGFIGGEREAGYLEARWIRSKPADQHIVFRNIGWPGDNVLGAARTSGFQNPGGIERLLKEVRELKPTEIVIGYGMNESFDGPDGLPAFQTAYRQLLEKLTPLNARLLLLSPSYHEDLGRPWPEPTEHNQHLEKYTAAIKQLAEDAKARFVDVFHPMKEAIAQDAKARWTTNGIQLNDAGYRRIAAIIAKALGMVEYRPLVAIDARGRQSPKEFKILDGITLLPVDRLFLQARGLKPGKYIVTINEKEVARATAEQLADKIELTRGAPFEVGEDLCKKIVYRNDLFYRRWRPFNDHSRHWGFIGKDFALWEAQVEAQDKAIHAARQPKSYVVEIKPAS